MSPLYLCMKLNFVSSVEDVPKTYIPVQWETSISPGRARTTVFNHGLIVSSKLGDIWNDCENVWRHSRISKRKGGYVLENRTTSGDPVFCGNASNIFFLNRSARSSSLSSSSSSLRLPRAITRTDSCRRIPNREYNLPLGYYSTSSSQDGAQCLAYYIEWASRPEYQMARFHNAQETKPT